MKLLFEVIMIAHGLLHLPAFVRVFFSEPPSLKTESSTKETSLLWLIAALLFFITAGLLFFNSYYWWAVSFAAILISQVNILIHWKETKSGTLVNLALAVVTYIAANNAWHIYHNSTIADLAFYLFI